jgi:hypothetical protein
MRQLWSLLAGSWKSQVTSSQPRPRGFPKKALGGIAAVVMAPSAARKPPGKGKTPKPDLRKRKTGKKKDEDGKPDAEPKETAEVRLVERRRARGPRTADRLFSAPASTPALTRALHARPYPASQERSARKKAAKEARKAKGESVLSEGGTRPCKICQKVRRGRASWSTAVHATKTAAAAEKASRVSFFLSAIICFSLLAAHRRPATRRDADPPSVFLLSRAAAQG